MLTCHFVGFAMFVLMLFVPVNKFSVMSGRVPGCLLGLNQYQAADKCIAQGHITVTLGSSVLPCAGPVIRDRYYTLRCDVLF